MDPIRVFISYCHVDAIWLAEWENEAQALPNPKCLLKQWERAFEESVEFWYDRGNRDGLRGGDLWEKRIFDEIDRSDIAVLLITQDFMLSPFIKNKELPRIKEKFNSNELLVLPVLAQPTRKGDLEKHDLFKLQWTPDSSTSLSRIYEDSKTKFEEAKIQVLDALELMIDKVKKRRDIANKVKNQDIKSASPKENSTQTSKTNGLTKQRKKLVFGAEIAAAAVIIIIFFIMLPKGKSSDIVQLVQEEHIEKQVPQPEISKEMAPTGFTVISSSSSPEPEKKPQNMVWIEGGTFMMGSENGENTEKPAHKVTVNGFYMDKTDVTQEEYNSVMRNNPSHFKDCPECPVEEISWDEAKKYCEKVNKRLPTEAEWEYACKAGSTTKYYWGNEMNGEYAWYEANSEKMTHPVGQKKPNSFGLYDMIGNVREWCNDWYDENYYSNSPLQNPKGPMQKPKSPMQNPKGPIEDTYHYRVLRGGYWNGRDNMRCACRDGYLPAYRNDGVGFRCVQ
jgi:formylglycine-generating enzyme required for sulfatase activity